MTDQVSGPMLAGNPRRTVRVVLTFGALLLFLLLAIGGLFTPVGQALDQIVLDVAMGGSTRVGWVSDVLTQSITATTIAVAAAVIMLIAAIRARFALAMRVGVMILGANIMAQLFKTYLIHRPYMGVGFDLPNSFPSGHATVLMSLALGLVIVLPRKIRSIAALVLSLAVSAALVSVVMLGWHRPSDVVGGILIAFMWAMALAPQEEPSPVKDTVNTAAITVSMIVILAVGLAFAVGGQQRGRIAQVVAQVEQGVPVDMMTDGAGTIALIFTIGVCAVLVALAVLAVNLVVYLQTGRASK
ncbi:MAG: phosphatase PAP2 family protein [Actinomycetaceae bacterium]|nr:phosphatase PAP2 family protein [Actinomycetaceae bacterium]